MPATTIDPLLYDAARQLLDRESSRAEEASFQRLLKFVFAGFAFMIAWLLVLMTWSVAQWPLFMGMWLCFLSAAALFLFNWRYASRLWRSARIARQMRLILPIDNNQTTVARRWLTNVALLGVHATGYGVIALGLIGLVDSRPLVMAFAIALVLIGWTFVALYPMSLLNAQETRLRDFLDRHSDTTAASFPAAVYQEFSDVERLHIELEREQLAVTRRSTTNEFQVRVHANVFESVSSLDEVTQGLVRQAVLDLSAEPVDRATLREPETIEQRPVPGSPIALQIRRDLKRKRLEVIGLVSESGHA